MSQFEEQLREKLARRAEQMPVTPDLADVHARLDRVEDRRDTRFNAVALVGAAAVVAVIIGLATMMARDEPALVASSSTSTTVARSNEMAQRLTIATAFDRVFEAATPDVERLAGIIDNTGLEAVAAEIRTRDPQRLLDQVQVQIDSVKFVLPSVANVTFSITSTEFAGKTEFSGQAIRQGGDWKIARATFCAVIEKVDVRCPAP